jgi:histidinol dehydrogenase
MKTITITGKSFQKLCCRNIIGKRRIVNTVKKIIEDVRLHGDEAVVKYTKKFDKIKLTPRELKVTETEMSGAYQDIKPEFVNTLKMVIENVNRFYKKNNKKSWKMVDGDGVMLGENYRPLESVGIYIPSGTVPLVSTIYMTVLPAKIAGVERIVLITPPNEYKSVDPHILVVADLLKVKEIYKAGGSQAIAALAFGTKTIPKVDKIVGPGNAYVTEAKRQVFGYVDIDMTAGPSEVVIVANQYSNPAYVKADLAAQSEHFMGLSVLVTTSKRLARVMKKEVDKGYVILVKNIEQAAEVVNKLAPEHLEIMIKSPYKLLKQIRHAGAIFIGPYSPTAVGDYIAGPSHVLPTGGTARFFSGLGSKDFIKSSHIISYSKKALEKGKDSLEKLTGIERLQKHFESVKVRFE